jgi:hypothetical protein
MKKLSLCLLTLGLAILPLSVSGSVSSSPADNAFLFVEIETVVHRAGVETSSENPEERRWYFSNVIVQPEDVLTYSLKKQRFMPYFSRNVMDPAEARGILIDYGEQDVRLNGESSFANYATRAEAEEERNKAIEYRKGQSGNIYSFEINFDNPKGEETSKPKLIYRDKEQAHYEK